MAVQEPGRARTPLELQRARRDRQVAASTADDPAAHERAIAAGLCADDPEPLEAAFRSWAGMIHGYCRKAVGDAADDLTQQVFVEAWRTRAGFDPDRGVVPAWLVGIARNVVARHRSSGHRTPTPVAEIADRATDADRDAGDADRLADRTVVAAALDVLSHLQRATLRMSFFDGLSQSEIVVDDGNARLDVDLSVLPEETDGFYEVWLLDLDDGRMVSLGPARADGTYPLPRGVDVDDYPAMDVSVEPHDGDPTHSGASVLRGSVTT